MRTILISLYSNIVVGNFTAPGGVLDQLMARKRPDTAVVFLTAEGFREKLARHLSGDVQLETIEKHTPRGWLQSLFHFFYAYLIFTGTTRILATYGARADTPPAGGNRFIAPLKALNARTFGRSRFVKTKLVPRLYQMVFRSRPYRALFDRHQPSLVVLPNIAFFPDIELLAEAKRRAIRTVGMACNWDHLNKYFIPFQADHLLVQNEPMRREAVALQAYRRDRTESVGFPQFDQYHQYLARPDPRERFCRAMGIPPESRIIVFISGAAYALDEPDIVREIVRWMEAGAFGLTTHLLLRPYVIARDRESEERKFREFRDHPLISWNLLRRDESEEGRERYLAMLRHADVVIPVFSTMAIEAAIFDRPTVAIGFDGHARRPFHQSIRRLEQLAHFRHVLDTGSIVIARSFPELFERIHGYLHHPERDRAQRRALVERLCYRFDGRASERVADAIIRAVRGVQS